MKDQLSDKRTAKVKHWIIRLLTLSVVIGGAGACQKEDMDRVFEGPYFVRFTDSTLTYKESYSKPVSIKVHNVGPQLSQPITVNYTVNGSAREGKDYTIVGTKGTVIIPANKSFGEISVQLINNANNILNTQSLTFTLTGVQPSDLQIGFGKDNILGKSLMLTIQDDCLLGGAYSGSSRVGSQTYTISDAAITSTDCKNYILSNWNIGIFNFDAIKTPLTFVDNGDNSLTVPTQSNAYLGTNESVKGTGAWNPRDKKITLNLQLLLKLANPDRDTTITFTQTYTPQ
ncbi:hypothetical protein [Spirosoma sp. KNUC1025]|uniref:hypothetical protein n=1 Tax=Spirosoma sp. KNUC1025 TaxID=2894082 RepID=UPI0038693889|nr:hypothetical protein LN737_08320 [Spirosoma sp. KNUC1025]